jgi:hypothetical protein
MWDLYIEMATVSGARCKGSSPRIIDDRAIVEYCVNAEDSQKLFCNHVANAGPCGKRKGCHPMGSVCPIVGETEHHHSRSPECLPRAGLKYLSNNAIERPVLVALSHDSSLAAYTLSVIDVSGDERLVSTRVSDWHKIKPPA